MNVKTLNRAVVLIFALTGFIFAQDGTDNRPTVKVTGAAEVNVVPDQVSFSLKVSKSDKNLAVAKGQNDENIQKIIEITRRFGIPARDVKPDFISITEKYDRVKLKGDDEFTNVFAGYTVSKTLVVKLVNIDRFEEFLTEATKIGLSQLSNVTFESSELRKYKDQARVMAMQAAREKAAALAGAVNQTIGKAVSIIEENVDGYRSPYANARSNSFATDGDDSATQTIGTISVKAQIEVRFLLN